MYTQIIIATRNIIHNNRSAYDQLAHIGAGWSICAHLLVQFAVGMDADQQVSKEELFHAVAEYLADTGMGALYSRDYNQQMEMATLFHELFMAIRHHVDTTLHQRVPNGFISNLSCSHQTVGFDMVVDVEISQSGWSRNKVRQDAEHV